LKERIYKYLLETGKAVESSRILSDVLGICSPKAHSADSVLAGFLGQDARFVSTGGRWHLSSTGGAPAGPDFERAAVLHLQSPRSLEILQGLRGAIRLPDGRCREFAFPVSSDALNGIRSEIEGSLLIAWCRRELRLWNGLLRSKGLEAWQGETLFLQSIAARALKRVPSKLTPECLARELGLPPPDEERPLALTRYLYACWPLLLERIPADFRRDLDSLGGWIRAREKAVDFGRFAFGPDFLRRLPDASGIYMMMDFRGRILYVGKSRNLKRRVSSYFTPRALSHPKIAKIYAHLRSIEILKTDNEVEALLMEMRVIKDFRPPINLQTDVHGPQGARHEGRNFLVLAVDAQGKRVNIYLFRNGIFAGRHLAPLGRSPSKRLRERLESLFFTQGGGKRRGEAWEKEIVSRWFKANQRRLNYMDVDETADFQALLSRLRNYLCDPDKLENKVYYR